MLDDVERTDHERAAVAYLVWPLAALALVRERDTASAWQRIHTRQAFVYGLAAGVAAVVLLALPLAIVVVVPGISTGATLAVYAAGLLLDLVAFVWFVVATLRYSARTSRGELFAIPVVGAFADRLFGER